MPTLLVTHPSSLRHATPQGHPERVARLEEAILPALGASEFGALRREEAPKAPVEALLRLHPAEYLDSLAAAVPERGWTAVDSDTFLCPATLEAALHAAGAAIHAVDRVAAGEAGNAFCATRPPGHHAERSRAMGFCFLGNVAVAARHAIEVHGLERVAIIDFDVHHGNGTQDLVSDDPRILFVSTHQMPLYPGTGRESETGCGNVVNIPLAPGTGGEGYRDLFSRRAVPAVDAFRPQLVIASAGFDAHRDDPLAQIDLAEEDLGWVTSQLLALAARHAGGRFVSCLEGGYDLRSLAAAGAEHVRVMMRGG